MEVPEKLEDLVHNDELISNTFIGGYPVCYITEDNNVYCSECATKILKGESTEAFPEDLVDYHINYEDGELYCNSCSEKIECAYEGE